MIKQLKVTSSKVDKPRSVKMVEGDLSRIGAKKFRKVEFVKIDNNRETKLAIA